MIRLEIQTYCNDCPDFKPKTERPSRRDEDGLLYRDTVIYCAHRNRCRALARYLINQKLS